MPTARIEHVARWSWVDVHVPTTFRMAPTMNDKETVSDPSHEAAAAKLWAVYVSEAEKYDKGLVESWKSDMQGILFFAGLFSASLTAFLIESYKTLSLDPADKTVLLLAQISQQISAAANGTTLNIPIFPAFAPPAGSVVCNFVWFISLGLALTSALVATLVEQWARDFLHRAEIRSAPVIRARIFSFLYYGLKRFKMHTVVELIPLLLHASLILFFAGLVAFLVPVNPALTVLAGTLLLLVTAVYTALTLLPLYYLDAPYRTPLSGVIWPLRKLVMTFASRRMHLLSPHRETELTVDHDTIVDSIFLKATEVSDERDARDQTALIWTVKSLTDNTELEPFIEALPDVLWKGDERRYVYDGHIQALAAHRDVQLIKRIADFYSDCFGGHLSGENSERRQILCHKVVWALGSLSLPDAFGDHPLPVVSLWHDEKDDVRHYSVSGKAMGAWGNFHAARTLLQETLDLLAAYSAEFATHSHPVLQKSTLVSALQRLQPFFSEYTLNCSRVLRVIEGGGANADNAPPNLTRIITLMRDIESLRLPHALPLRILTVYAEDAAELTSPPYNFRHTTQILCPQPVPLSESLLGELQSALENVARTLISRRTAREFDKNLWLNGIIANLIRYWNPADKALSFPASLIRYMNHCDEERWWQFGEKFTTGGWLSVPSTITRGPRVYPYVGMEPIDVGVQLQESLIFVSTLLKSTSSGDRATMEAVLNAVMHSETVLSTPIVVAMCKRKLSRAIFYGYWEVPLPVRIAQFWHPIFPEDTGIQDATEQLSRSRNELGFGSLPFPKFIDDRRNEGLLQSFTELIEACISADFPPKVGTTLNLIGLFIPCSTILPSQQIRFAAGVKNIFEIGPHRSDETVKDTLHAIIEMKALDLYAATLTVYRTAIPWLDDPEARQMIKETFAAYLANLSGTEYPDLLERGQAILTNLAVLHPDTASDFSDDDIQVAAGGSARCVGSSSPPTSPENVLKASDAGSLVVSSSP